MEPATGYFTIERNIVNSTPQEMEATLGLPPRWLAQGARILVLLRQPAVGEFVFAGSTRYPNATGLVGLEQRRNFPIPHAWLGQRLVKVKALGAPSATDNYPKAVSPVEQWQLVVPIPAREVCQLAASQKYWPPR